MSCPPRIPPSLDSQWNSWWSCASPGGRPPLRHEQGHPARLLAITSPLPPILRRLPFSNSTFQLPLPLPRPGPVHLCNFTCLPSRSLPLLVANAARVSFPPSSSLLATALTTRTNPPIIVYRSCISRASRVPASASLRHLVKTS